MVKLRIVFIGTPKFALPSLQKLIDMQEDLLGVVTQPDRPVGRGQNLKAPPVKELALKYNIPVFQPQNIKTPQFMEDLKGLSPDLVVVVAYGRIFPRALLEISKYGFINVHSSLLPAYRGSAPISRAIINGAAETGITIMLLDEGMDSGDIILKEATPILPDDNAETLHDRLALLGAKLLGLSVDMLKTGSWDPTPQDHSQATYAPMLKKEDGLICWDKDARCIANRIRGMSPWPGCFTYLNGKLLKIHRAEVVERDTETPPGRIIAASKAGIEVAAGEASLVLKEVQLEGKKKIAAGDFIKGYRLAPGTTFSNSR